MAAMGGHVKKSNINMANLCYLAQESIWLVALTILKKIVNGKDYPIYYGQKKCLKPPTCAAQGRHQSSSKPTEIQRSPSPKTETPYS